MNQPYFGGKRDGHRHSTMSFRENAVVAKTSYQMLEILYSYRERASPPSTEISELTYVAKNKYNDAFLGARKLKIK